MILKNGFFKNLKKMEFSTVIWRCFEIFIILVFCESNEKLKTFINVFTALILLYIMFGSVYITYALVTKCKDDTKEKDNLSESEDSKNFPDNEMEPLKKLFDEDPKTEEVSVVTQVLHPNEEVKVPPDSSENDAYEFVNMLIDTPLQNLRENESNDDIDEDISLSKKYEFWNDMTREEKLEFLDLELKKYFTQRK